MKILLSFVFCCTLLFGADAQTSLYPSFTTSNNVLVDEDALSNDLPRCLYERIVKELRVEVFTVEYLFTNTLGKRIYRYEISATEFGFFSISELNCMAEIKIEDDVNDLLFVVKDN